MQLAYLDAGAGSLIASAVVGGAAAAGVAVRSARARMAGALGRKRKDGTGAAEGAEVAPDGSGAPAADATGPARSEATGDGPAPDA